MYNTRTLESRGFLYTGGLPDILCLSLSISLCVCVCRSVKYYYQLVCMFVCLSLCLHVSKTTCPNFPAIICDADAKDLVIVSMKAYVIGILH